MLNIPNPWLRTVAGGFLVGSLVTIPATLSLVVINPKDESAKNFVIYTSLGGAACGLLIGLRHTIPKLEEKVPWQTWREFTVRQKSPESAEIISFYLQPKDQAPIPNYMPGQFLTIQLAIPTQTRPVIRTYSLSDYSLSPSYYRLSIKREPTPPNTDFPSGIASNFLHDQIEVGSIILAKPPAGKFVADLTKTTPLVLISNGVGITPMVAIAKAVTIHSPDRQIWFLHGVRDGSFHAFRDELQAIANPNLHIVYAYSRPRSEDAGIYHYQGYVDLDLLKKEVQSPETADYYLCGSPAFMDNIRSGLKELGIEDSRVHFESFSKALPKPKIDTSDPVAKTVTFNQSGHTFNWVSDQDSILEFAEAHDIYPDHSCRSGLCGTCATKLIAGEVEYVTEPTASVEQDKVLICISRPKTDNLILDI